MTNLHDDLWAVASRDVVAENAERIMAMSMVAVAPVVPFLFGASSLPEYEQRLAIQGEKVSNLLESVTSDPDVHTAILDAMRTDFLTLQRARVEARLEKAAGTSTYCPNHGVYVGEGNQEQHDHCKTEQRKTKESASNEQPGFYRQHPTGGGNDALEWMPTQYKDQDTMDKERLFPNGIPLRGDLTPEQQAWMDKGKKKSSKTAGISLTNVGIVDKAGLVCKGKNPSGTEVKFKVTKSEMDQLSAVLYGDLAINFSGVSVDEGDIIKDASRKTAVSRPLYEIADEIQRAWGNVNFGAKPYLDAMKSLDSMSDRFYEDDAKSIVLYFISNASSFRGPDAQRLKAELRAMLKTGAKTAAGGRVECNSCGAKFRDTTSLGAEKCKQCGSSDLKTAKRDGDGATFRHDVVAGSKTAARLVRGDQLSPSLQQSVLSRYVYRWTSDNPQRVSAWGPCSKCDIRDPYVNTISSEGHSHPTMPLVSDKEWLTEHAFSVVNDGSRLAETGGGAQPGFMADGSKTAGTSTYCPNHGVYVGEGNQEQHDHCKTEQRKTKESARHTAFDQDWSDLNRTAQPDPKAYENPADWGSDEWEPLRCKNCGVEIVKNYDGPSTGWSHLYPDAREGMVWCEKGVHASRHTAAEGTKCWDCGGSGSVPAQGGEDPDDVDNGQVKCPICDGEGNTTKTGSFVR